MKAGLLPQVMEDKWFIFFEEPWLYFHRSWTGFGMYGVRFESSLGSMKAVEAWASRDESQYRWSSDEYDRALLKFLIDALLLNKNVAFPVPDGTAGPPGIYQHALVGRAYPEVALNPSDGAKNSIGRNFMLVEAEVAIKDSKAAVWAAITDIENAARILSGVEKIEVLEKPAVGVVGLKWRETRMLFGKPEAVDKWITEATENEFYKTRAEMPGFVFVTTVHMSGSDGAVTLRSSHETQPQGFVAHLKSLPMVLFKGVVKKAILKDLNDLKTAVEAHNRS